MHCIYRWRTVKPWYTRPEKEIPRQAREPRGSKAWKYSPYVVKPYLFAVSRAWRCVLIFSLTSFVPGHSRIGSYFVNWKVQVYHHMKFFFIFETIKRATKTAIALSGLRYLRPEQMRQLYQACVAPIVDYASTVWHDPLRDKVHIRHLNTVQRIVLIRILSAFRTVATATLEVEA
jgi:hypothetical protein